MRDCRTSRSSRSRAKTRAPAERQRSALEKTSRIDSLLARFALAIVGVLPVDRSERHRALQHLDGREPPSACQFADRYFAREQVRIAEVLV